MGLAFFCSKATVLLLLIYWLSVLSLLFLRGCVMIGPWFAMYYLVAFYFCNHLAEEEIACCFPLIVFLLALLIVVSALCLFLTVSWIGLQCVIVTFPGHTYLFVEVHNTCCCFFFSFLFHYSLFFCTSHDFLPLLSYMHWNALFVYDNHTSNIVLLGLSLTVKAALHECVIRTSQP